MNKKAKIARFEAMGGREGIAERALEIAKEMASGSYKRIIAGVGQMRVLAEICEADDYWDQKSSYGYRIEEEIANGGKKVNIRDDGNAPLYD